MSARCCEFMTQLLSPLHIHLCMCERAADISLVLLLARMPWCFIDEDRGCMPAACSADKKTEEEERQRREQGREADKAGRRTRKGGRGPPLSSIAKGTFPHTHTMARQPIRVLASLTRPPSYNCSSMAQRSRCEVMQAKEENTGLEIFLSG